MGSGGKSGSKVAGNPAAVAPAGGGGGHADGPGGAAGGVDASAPVTMVSPVATGPVASLHTGVAKIASAPKAYKPTAGGVMGFLGAAKPLAKQFSAAYSGHPDYQALPPEQKEKLWTAAKDAAKGYLESVPKVELQKAATASGFQHPTLIGQDDPKGTALTFVLNPFYNSPNAQKAKEKIQAKALAKFAALPPAEQEKLKQQEEEMAQAALADSGTQPAEAPDEAVAGQDVAESQTAPNSTSAEPPPEPPKVTLPKLISNYKTSFTDLLKSLAGLTLTRKAAQELPPWRGRAIVEKLVWHHEGAAGHLGGVHEKHFYRTPDGQRWLFKPDKKAGGAVAAAEEAAAEIARRVGMPAVEVRRVNIGGKVGSVQPLAGDPSKIQPLPVDPTAWTPEQRASIMAQHVVDWLVGDHDGNHQNFILVGEKKTPVRIDRGQAFKFFGEDKLTLDYEPNKVHGAQPHAALALYRAAKAGKVSVNPMLLSPILQAIEQIPDQEYRAMLRPAAELGVKSKQVGWYQAAVNRAALKTGQASPPDGAVVDAFLDMAVQRKQTARQQFEQFLSGVLGQPFQFVSGPTAVSAAGMEPGMA